MEQSLPCVAHDGAEVWMWVHVREHGSLYERMQLHWMCLQTCSLMGRRVQTAPSDRMRCHCAAVERQAAVQPGLCHRLVWV